MQEIPFLALQSTLEYWSQRKTILQHWILSGWTQSSCRAKPVWSRSNKLIHFRLLLVNLFKYYLICRPFRDFWHVRHHYSEFKPMKRERSSSPLFCRLLRNSTQTHPSGAHSGKNYSRSAAFFDQTKETNTPITHTMPTKLLLNLTFFFPDLPYDEEMSFVRSGNCTGNQAIQYLLFSPYCSNTQPRLQLSPAWFIVHYKQRARAKSPDQRQTEKQTVKQENAKSSVPTLLKDHTKRL